MNDDALSLVIEQADGTITRWGPDELDPADVPGGLEFTTSMPGGDKTLDCELLRRIDLDYADQSLLDRVRVIGPGNETVWDGILQQFPRQHGNGFSVSPGAVGWSSLLGWHRGFQMIYVDRDLSGWGQASRQRRVNLLGASYAPVDGSTRPDTTTGSPCLATEVTGAWTATSLPIAEAWYDAGPGNSIDKLYYAWTRGTNVNNADTNWQWYAHLLTDDVAAVYNSTANLRAAGPSTGTLAATAATRRWALVQLYYASGPAGDDNKPYNIDWTCLAVYGDHDLTLRGTATASTPQGVYVSDVIAHALAATTPEIAAGDIEDTSLSITHLTFPGPTTAEDVILTCNAYHLYDWGVTTGLDKQPTFFFRYPDPDRLTWITRLDEGCEINDDGPQSVDLYDGVIVTYQDAAGTAHQVGPTGSGAENESDDLIVTDETNPVVAHGLGPKYALLESSQPLDLDTATAIGRIFLLERSIEQRRGQITVQGTVTHPTAGPRPAWAVKAGDWIKVTDAGKTLGVPRKVIETRYSHASRQNVLTLDTPAWTLDAILERIGVAQVGVV